MRNELENKTVKELRELAKEKDIVGRWNMTKQELIDALSNGDESKKTTREYLSSVEPGTLVAFKRNKDKDIAMSGKFISFDENGKVTIESKKGTLFKVSPENVIWVKTGARWPKWVFSLFNKEESEVEGGNAIS